jgi:hypothetical protein
VACRASARSVQVRCLRVRIESTTPTDVTWFDRFIAVLSRSAKHVPPTSHKTVTKVSLFNSTMSGGWAAYCAPGCACPRPSSSSSRSRTSVGGGFGAFSRGQQAARSAAAVRIHSHCACAVCASSFIHSFVHTLCSLCNTLCLIPLPVCLSHTVTALQ